jgi:1,2-dihydroxy-3-keto-5-methylthiopentene dioxygenase
MSSLFVYHVSSPQVPDKVLNHLEDIASTLAEHGVALEHRDGAAPIKPGASREEVINACRGPLDTLMTERGYATFEVISLDSNQAPVDQAYSALLDEHVHDEDELRLFVAGRGLLNLHIGDYVYALLCERNDLVAVPAGTRQWFDMGERPYLIALRLFKGTSGSLAKLTGDPISGQFQRLDD